MKNFIKQTKKQCLSSLVRGVTLIEMTIVILVILLLVGISIPSIGAYRIWETRSTAEQVLRELYTAQRTYLAENPTVDPGTLAEAVMQANITPYLSNPQLDANGVVIFPTVEDVDGSELGVSLTVSPPALTETPSWEE